MEQIYRAAMSALKSAKIDGQWDGNNTAYPIGAALRLLKQFINSGFTPEEVAKFAKYEKMARSLLKDLEDLFAYRASGLSTERCMELAQAEEQGLLVRLPCKVGDTVYQLRFVAKCDGCPDNQCLPVEKCKLYTGGCARKDKWIVDEIPFTLGCLSSRTLKLGRQLYAIRAEAEAALLGSEG